MGCVSLPEAADVAREDSVGKIAGGRAANTFCTAAMAAVQPIKAMTQFQWGATAASSRDLAVP